MGEQYIVVSSITYAYKGQSALERKGFRVKIEKAPKELSSCGCNYALKVKNAPLSQVVEILQKAKVRIISTGGPQNDLS